MSIAWDSFRLAGMADSPTPSASRSNRRMTLVIAAMVVVWLAVVLCRNPIRAHWWAYRLAATTDPPARMAYFERLIALGPVGASGVETLLSADDASIRGLGVAVVNHTKPTHARKLLRRMATDSDPEVATIAVAGLAMMDDAAVVEDMIGLLGSAEPRVVVEAVSGLGRRRTTAAVDSLISTARVHPLVAARVQAIEELGLIGADQAIAVLRECLNDDTLFEGRTAAERSAAISLGYTAPYLSDNAPPPARAVSHFAARALRTITGGDTNTNGV